LKQSFSSDKLGDCDSCSDDVAVELLLLILSLLLLLLAGVYSRRFWGVDDMSSWGVLDWSDLGTGREFECPFINTSQCLLWAI
jgi:hypothetical protein